MDLKYVTGPITKADAGSLEAVISTPKVDSDGERVDPLGLTNRAEWLTNPLIYWAHEWAFDPTAEPIGKGTALTVHTDRIESAAQYAPTPKAQNVRALVVGGFVRKTSIGFDPIEMKMVGGVPTHTRWALREWSIVPMPANSDATITGVKSALRWLADGMPDVTETDDGAILVGTFDAEAFLASLDDAQVTLGNDGPQVTLREGGRVIARLRPRRVLRA